MPVVEWVQSVIESLPMREYAERGHDTSFWGEPLNAFTGLLFVVAVAVAHRDLRRHAVRTAPIVALLVLGVIHGAGSFLYHTARSPYTLVADFLPMASFVLLTIAVLLRVLSGRWLVSLALIASLIGLQVVLALTVPKDFLNGSYRHGATVLALVGVVAWVRHSRYAACWRLAATAIALYVAGVVCRSIDQAVASTVPVGTHFLWHVFTALASYLAIRLLMRLELVDRGAEKAV